MVKLQWLLGDFADPQHELSPAEQREVSRLAHRKYMPPRHFFVWTLLALLVPVGLAFKVALPTVLDWLGLGGRTLPFIAGVAVIIALFWVWCAWVYGIIYARPVRQAMRDLGHDVCVGCGYVLSGLKPSTPRCPECGVPREPLRRSDDD
jgi:hypothetical protein